MYTYMSICIYIKKKNTVCHIWFMCNTFSGCLKLVVSSTLLCRGIAHVRCYWSCLPWIVAWSWRKDNVTSTFLTYCHISHLHWVYRTHPQSRTQTHRWLSSLPCQLTSDLFPPRTSAGVTDCLLNPRRYLPPDLFFSPYIPTHQCHYSSTCIQSCTCFSSSHFFCSTQWHVPFFCFFCEFGCRCHTEKNNTKKTNKTNKKKKKQKKNKKKNLFPNCGGWGFGGEHNINQGCRVRNTARGSSRHPTSS